VGISILGWEGEEVLKALLEDREIDLPVPEAEAPPRPTSMASGTKPGPPPASGSTGAAGPDAEPIPAGGTRPQGETGPEEAVAGTVILDLAFTSRVPDGVLTLYADDQQILKQQFKYDKKSRFLRPKRALGGFESRLQISSATRTLRIYLLVDAESKLTTLSTDLSAGETRRLIIELYRKGTVEARLE
jgi:hypothetical protein